MVTVGSRLAAHRGFGPGFDFLRLALASGVVLWHCFPLTTGTPAVIEATPLWFLVSSMVPMFFALSGFLVIASATRIPVGPFLANRAARILPALAVVVLVSAFVLGPAVTTLPQGAYFGDPLLWRYLGNMVGLVAYLLPGVFADNPFAHGVNGSLWTVPHEIACYLLVAGLMLFGLARRWWVLALIYVGLLGAAMLAWQVPAAAMPAPLGALLHAELFASGSKIIPFFLLGAIAYLARDRIPADWRLAALSLVIVLAIGAMVSPDARKSPLLWLGSGVPLTYIVVWAGLARLPKPNFFGGGDFSYGVYLWHFPVLQLLVWLTGITLWWQLGLLAVLPVLLVAAASWHFVEKPVLRWRRRTSMVGSRLAGEAPPAMEPKAP